MHWFGKNKYPEFWHHYTAAFKQKLPNELATVRFVALDTETTGLNIMEDRILSIGAVAIVQDQIRVTETFEIYVEQTVFKSESVKIHGLLKEGKLKKVNELQAITQLLTYLKNAVIIGHHIDFDIAMINQVLKRQKLPPLKNKLIDTGVLYNKTIQSTAYKHTGLDELTEIFKIDRHDRHTAVGDAYITALLFLKLLRKLKKKDKNIQLSSLLYSRKNHSLL